MFKLFIFFFLFDSEPHSFVKVMHNVMRQSNLPEKLMSFLSDGNRAYVHTDCVYIIFMLTIEGTSQNPEGVSITLSTTDLKNSLQPKNKSQTMMGSSALDHLFLLLSGCGDQHSLVMSHISAIISNMCINKGFNLLKTFP